MLLTHIELAIRKGANTGHYKWSKPVDYTGLRGHSINQISEKTGIHHKKLKRIRHLIDFGG